MLDRGISDANRLKPHLRQRTPDAYSAALRCLLSDSRTKLLQRN